MPTKKKATRRSRDDGYGRSSRFYTTPEGAIYPSVTTALKVVAKPALINWAAKEERIMVLAALRQVMDSVPQGEKLSRLQFMARVENSIGEQKANVKLKNKAGEIGTQIHAMAEWVLRLELKQKIGPEPALSPQAESGFIAWDDWRKKTNLVPLLIEQVVYSNKHKYAGTLDLLCEMDLPETDIDGNPTKLSGRGQVMVDWKSGKSIYVEARLQTAAYVEALIEMGHAKRPLHGMIVRVPKIIGDPDVETGFITAKQSSKIFKGFLHTLGLWRYLDEAKGL